LLVESLSSRWRGRPCLCAVGLARAGAQRAGNRSGFARGWLAPEFDRFGFASYQAMGFAPAQRMNWSLSLGERTSLGLSVNSRDYDYDPRALSVFGRYWLPTTGR
jgi:hypothetical protein